MQNTIALILAAGEGTRMKSKKTKVLHQVLGKEMINWVVDAAKKSKIEEIGIVVGKNGKEVKNKVGNSCEFFVQEERLGTGHAVMQAEKYLRESSLENVIVLYADVPLISSETINKLINFHEKNKYAATILSAILEDPTGYGRIVKDENENVLAIREHKDADEKIRKIKEINSGMIVFNRKILLDALSRINNKNNQNEYYLTDTVEIIHKQSKIGSFVAENSYEIAGVNDRVQLSKTEKRAKDIINKRHQLNGVTIENPEATFIGPDVVIEKDVTIYQNSRLEGKTYISEDSVIGPDSQIVDSKIGENTKILKSNVLSSEVGNNTSVGPFAYIRPESIIGDNIRIGDFVEIKKSKIGNRTKISHLTYVGDAVVGENCNFGCGVVIVNYDGKKKNLTQIGNNVFIGCNVNLVSPVTIEDDSYIAAGSTITQRVEKNSLAIARARQINKKDWVLKRNMQRK